MVRSIVIPHDTAQRPWLEEVANIGHFQMLVDGWLDYIEIPAAGVTVYLNEAARRSLRPLNTRASALSWFYNAGPADNPILLGDVVLTGMNDHEGWHDLPASLEHVLLGCGEFSLEVSPEGDDNWHDTYAHFSNFFDAATWCLLFSFSTRHRPRFRLSYDAPAVDVNDDSQKRGEQPW